MKIFLDTNVFYNDWFMNNANFKYLFHFLNNEGHELILSKLVIQEVENIRRRDIDSCLTEINKQVKKAQKLNGQKLVYSEKDLGIGVYELLPLIKEKVDIVKVFDYEEVSHSEVVNRALRNKKPFLEGEKGYRDTLIWLSFLKYIEHTKQDNDDIVFITANKSDFFNIKNKVVKFNADLEKDIHKKKLKSEIKAFTSLFDFVNSTIDINEHAVDKFNSEEIFEDFVEESGTEYIENMSHKDLSNYYEDPIFDSKVKEILDIRTDVWEGLEDPQFMHTTKLNGNDIYISYRYNLRRVTIEIDIPEMDYLENKDELHKIFVDIEVSKGVVTLISYVRPYFDVSFIYNDKNETFKDYEVAELWLRR